MYTPEELLKQVNRKISELAVCRQPATLYEPINYVLDLGGKRIRPVLMLLTYNLYRDDPERVLMQAVGLETYHNDTLLHDDLMDNSDVRRGHPTVHRRWNANTAILSGDAMLVLAYQRMQECDASHLKAVMDLFTITALELDEGQQYDIDFETRTDVTEDEYIEMIRLKTSVLMACAVKTGAILADASTHDQQLLYKFGEQLGLAFQLQDDLLDVYGDPKVFGKAIGGDITSNKKTYMLINAINRAQGGQRQELMRWIDAKTFDREEKVQAVTRIYDQLGIRQLCEQKIEFYFGECRKCLAEVSVEDSRKHILLDYINEMMRRKS